MKPEDKNTIIEIIAAMSAMNTRYKKTDLYLTDCIKDVELAHQMCLTAITEYNKGSKKYLNYLESAIVFLNRRDYKKIKHKMIKDAIEHLRSAIELKDL